MKLFNTTTISLFFVPLFATTTVFCAQLEKNKSKKEQVSNPSSTIVVVSHKKHTKAAAAETTPESTSEKMVMGELSTFTKFYDKTYGAAACVLSELQKKEFKKHEFVHIRRIDHAIKELTDRGDTQPAHIPALALQIATYVPKEQNDIKEIFNLCAEQEVTLSEIPRTLAHDWLIKEHAREMSLLVDIWASSTARIREIAELEASIRATSGIKFKDEIPTYSEDNQLFSAVLKRVKSEAGKKALAAQKDKDDSKETK